MRILYLFSAIAIIIVMIVGCTGEQPIGPIEKPGLTPQKSSNVAGPSEPACPGGLCDPNPCQNGGLCTEDGCSYICECPPGYSGTNCEIDIDECASNPCVNGACEDQINAYVCHCDPGWTGTNCDVPDVVDSDGDGVPDDSDLCPGTPADTPVDANGCPLNLALTKTATASSSKPAHPAGDAVDGSDGTHWRSGTLGGTDKAWWRVDLGAVYNIDNVVIDWMGNFYAKQYQIQVSFTGAAGTWETVFTDNLGIGGSISVFFTATDARYVRILMTQHNEPVERINEVEVYASGGETAMVRTRQ